MTPQRSVDTPSQREEERIREVYSRRLEEDRYSYFNPGQLLLLQDRERNVLATLKRERVAPLGDKEILEIGCGTGQWLRDLVKWGARPDRITGVELLDDRLEEARLLCPKAVRLVRGNAVNLQFPDGTFDLIVQSTVFTSMIDDDVKRRAAFEMVRVLKADGLILWYDFFVDNPWNADVRGVAKSEILSLFLECRVRLQRCTLAPPLLRRLAPYSAVACHMLGKVPWLCTHYLGAIRHQPHR